MGSKFDSFPFSRDVVSQTATGSRGLWDAYIAKAQNLTFHLQVDSLE